MYIKSHSYRVPLSKNKTKNERDGGKVLREPNWIIAEVFLAMVTYLYSA